MVSSLNGSVSLWVAIVFLLLSSWLVFCVTGEIEKTSFVTEVVDGDTFHTSEGDRVRLADIDAPEINQPGYSEAKDYLASLVDGKTVYMDVDDKYGTDVFGRLICVVYVDYNETHLLNVNEALVAGNYAASKDYENEFSPYSWSLFVLQNVNPTPSKSPTALITPTPDSGPGALQSKTAILGIAGILTITAMMLFLLLRKKKRD